MLAQRDHDAGQAQVQPFVAQLGVAHFLAGPDRRGWQFFLHQGEAFDMDPGKSWAYIAGKCKNSSTQIDILRDCGQ